MKCNPCLIADLLPKRRNAQNLTPLYGFGAILGVFFRYERLCFSGGILNVRHSKAAVCRFRVTKKRRIATTLLSCSAYFVAGVLGIPLVHDVQERREVIILWGGTVHIVVDGYEPNALFREKDFCVVANLQVVSAKTTEILYHKGLHSSGFDFFQQGGKTGTIKR